MNWAVLLRVALLAVAAAWLLSYGYRRMERAEQKPLSETDAHWQYWVWCFWLLEPLSVSLVYSLAVYGLADGWARFVYGALRQSLIMSVYYALLLLLMPRWRKRYNALACTSVWLMPSLLGLFRENRWNLLSTYSLPLVLPPAVLRLFGGLTLGGAAAVLLFAALRHRDFREELLLGSHAETDEAVLALWQEELARLKWKNGISLRRCERLQTPLALGMGRAPRYVFLPARSYTAAELRAVFRHELCHLMRHDPQLKLVLLGCCAVCWWNPLVWLALRRAAEDRELACDEYVTQDMSGEERRAYAELLLRQAGPAEGFTSCLSARAESLRHRMKGVLTPRERKKGGALIALLTAFLVLTGGVFVLSDGEGTAGELLFSERTEPLTVSHTRLRVAVNEPLFVSAERDENGFVQDPEELGDGRLSVTLGEEFFSFLSQREGYRLLERVELSQQDSAWLLTVYADGEETETLQVRETSLVWSKDHRQQIYFRWKEPLRLQELLPYISVEE